MRLQVAAKIALVRVGISGGVGSPKACGSWTSARPRADFSLHTKLAGRGQAAGKVVRISGRCR